MKACDVLNVLEEVAPLELSREFCKKYDMYDNSGIIIDGGNEITGAVFSLDLCEDCVSRAVKLGYNLIVTHHPAIFYGIKNINTVKSSQSRAIAECLKHGISVISMHLNFDSAPKGIDYYLMRGLGGENAVLSAELSNGGYGRVYAVKPIDIGEYVKYVKKEFNTERVLLYGGNRTVKKVASFCGAGCDDHNIDFATANGADVFVSADMKHHEIAELLGRGTGVIVLTHYASENYGFYKIYSDIKDRLGIKSDYYTQVDLL